MTDLATLAAADFQDRVGQPFALADGTTYELIEVSARDSPGAPRAPFSLVFAGPPDTVRPQGVHALAHPELGTLEIFLVPIAQDPEAVQYEAVFA